MSKRAAYTVTIAGSDVTSKLVPVLISATVVLNADSQADTAEIVLDDTNGRISIPREGAKISVALGWQGGAQRTVFSGTIDQVRSSGGRTGRQLSISAKGVDAVGRQRSSLRRHWDDATVKSILTDAGKEAGISKVSVDPQLASRVIKYWAMIDESYLAMGKRLAKDIGGNFRVQGAEALMARRGASYQTAVTAIYGQNLHSWDISPLMSLGVYGTIRSTWYDRAADQWRHIDIKTGLRSDAVLTLRPPAATEDEAKRKAQAAADTSKRDSGGGTVVIEGNPAAIPDALCAVMGARPSVDGAYRIANVTHNLSRGSGFVTSIELSQPEA
jgi:uncharacterized protein